MVNVNHDFIPCVIIVLIARVELYIDIEELFRDDPYQQAGPHPVRYWTH